MIFKSLAVAAIATLSFGGGAYLGQKDGIDKYHKLCYSGPPGFIVDEKDGTVVVCHGIPPIPDSERKFFAPPIDKE
jgi:hypothetical protein